MRSERLIICKLAIIVSVCLVLNGCGGEPWTYQADREVKPGPGLLSGEDGAFTIIGGSEKEQAEEVQTRKKTP